MNDDTEVRADAITRVRQAYEANSIPWDGSIASNVNRLTDVQIHALAAYWEQRAEDGPKEVWPDDAPPPPVELNGTLRAAKKVLDRATGNGALNRPARPGQRAFTASQIRYHG